MAAIGDAVEVDTPAGPVECEVVAVHDDGLVCMPFGDLRGVAWLIKRSKLPRAEEI